jgi:hypothetical protein
MGQLSTSLPLTLAELASDLPIDISRVDCPYTSSTCDAMYCRQRRHLYYGGENLKYFLTPSPSVPSFIGEQRWQSIQMGHSLHIRRRDGGGQNNHLMTMALPRRKHYWVALFKHCFSSPFSHAKPRPNIYGIALKSTQTLILWNVINALRCISVTQICVYFWFRIKLQ